MINSRKIGSRFRLEDDSYSPQSSNEIKYRREGGPNCSRGDIGLSSTLGKRVRAFPPPQKLPLPLLLSPLSATADLPLYYRLDKHLPLVSESHSSRATLRFRSWPYGDRYLVEKKEEKKKKKKASLSPQISNNSGPPVSTSAIRPIGMI